MKFVFVVITSPGATKRVRKEDSSSTATSIACHVGALFDCSICFPRPFTYCYQTEDTEETEKRAAS